MMLHSHFQTRGIRQKLNIDIYTVEKAPMATAGPAIGKYIIDCLGERGIGFHPQCQVQRIDGSGKAMVLADGTRVSYDLLIAIPPHTSPRAVRDSGLVNAAGWVPADPHTLELTDTPKQNRIFAIGDVTSVPLPGRFLPDMPLVMPKAGIFAERQGLVVASRIASHILGREPGEVFDGKGFCYIEVGGGKALRGDGSFFDLPHPTMTPRSPDAMQLAEKKAWVDSWMTKYL
jgi:sulfide:quinone oxidoreductase